MAFRACRTSFLTLSLSAAALLAPTAQDAHAGFQWTAPADMARPAAPAPQPMPSMPAPQVEAIPQMAPQMAPQTAPRPMPAPAPVPTAREPQIMMEPMGAPQMQAAPAPSAPQPNIVFHDSPSMMPGASVMPQNSTSSAPAQQAMPTPMPAPAPSIGVENGLHPSGQTPRRTRPTMAPQPIVPSQTASAAPQPVIGGAPATSPSGVDFVPTYSTAPGEAMTADKILRQRQEEQMVSQSAHWTKNSAPVNADTAPVMPQQAAPAMPQNVTSAPIPSMQTSAAAAAPMVETPFPPYGQHFENAVGFGKDLPLMTAVKQIVPDDFGLSFSAGVPTDINVSWQGGRPWNEALDLALAPHSLQSVVNGNIVTITHMTPTAPAPQMMPSQPMMAPTQYEEAGMIPAQKSVMMAPIIDDTMMPSETASPNPTNILQPAIGSSAMSAGGNPGDLYVPAASTAGPTTQPMIGTMAPDASAYPPVQPMNPQLYDNSIQYWATPKNSSLRETLASWSRKAGVEMFWASEYDYPIAAAVNIEGNFEEAVQKLLSGFAESSPRPLGRLHPNLPSGPAVLVIESRGMPQ